MKDFTCKCGSGVEFISQVFHYEHFPDKILFRVDHQGVYADIYPETEQFNQTADIKICIELVGVMRDRLWESGNVACAGYWATAFTTLMEQA